VIVAFDVDGTLIDDEDGWRIGAVSLAQGFAKAGANIWVWSFGGARYAELWGRRLMSQHAIPVERYADKYDWIAGEVGAPRANRINRSPDLHVDDSWSPKQLNGIILPYPHGLTRFSMKGHVVDNPQDPDLRSH